MASIMTAVSAPTMQPDESHRMPTSATAIERVIRQATATMSLMAKRNAINEAAAKVETAAQHDLLNSSSANNGSNEFLSISNGNNLAATITSIRTNVTRVLYMYFQNVTDEFGYGAATAGRTAGANRTSTVTEDGTVTAAEATSMTPRHSIGNVLDAAATIVHQHLTNTTQTPFDTTTMATEATATTTTTTTQMSTTTTTPALPTTANTTTALTTAPIITYPSYPAVRSFENCSALFANYTQPQQGIFCNWTWDRFLCWPPTPAGALARMHCPPGGHGIDTRKFANRKCELDGHWGSRPNDTYNPVGWTDYQPCFKPEVNEFLQQKNLDLILDIAKRTRTLEIVGLILSLIALIVSLLIFCNFRTLRNNRTKLHKNLFIAMVLQVIIRLTLYLDQAFKRGSKETALNGSMAGIENTPYLCEASYVLLEYARTAMFMWMFIEGLYLHNMVTVAVFQGRFPHTIFSLLGWGMPVLMTTVWAICTARYTDSVHDCWWNYNLTPYYWILEGPRLIVILLNFFFLMNIIRVLVVKLRQSQASDIEQTRKAVRAAIVLLPLLGITNLLHLVPAMHTPWKFALWSYVTHFLTSFQGFFIAMIYCFLNGEVRAVLLKSLAVYMSIRGHPEWAPKRASMFSGAYNTAPDTEAQGQAQDGKRNESPPNKRNNNGRRASCSQNPLNSNARITTRLSNSSADQRPRHCCSQHHLNHNHQQHHHHHHSNNNGNGRSSNWMITLCFRGQKNTCVMPSKNMPPQIFMTTKSNALA